MEELDIKQIWKQGGKGDSFGYSEEALDLIVKQQPQNIVSRFVKMLKFEKWANLIVLSGATVFLLVQSYWWFAAFMLFLDGGFFIYYNSLIRKLDRELIDSNVVQYLKEVHQSICRFIRHFKITLAVIGVISFSFGFYLGYSKHDDFAHMMESVTAIRWMIAAVVIVTSLVLAYYLFYQMYGKKAKLIKEMVESLDQEETED